MGIPQRRKDDLKEEDALVSLYWKIANAFDHGTAAEVISILFDNDERSLDDTKEKAN